MSLDLVIATTSYGVLCGAGENCWDHNLQYKLAQNSQHKKEKENKTNRKYRL